jgi:hypothetical protein
MDPAFDAAFAQRGIRALSEEIAGRMDDLSDHDAADFPEPASPPVNDEIVETARARNPFSTR